ncbi:hypothetical protein Y032_0615g689 [Ancylostoma ceylanicum]|uniref:Uncharacterized protein n=1 Tax=Ancylostoma ceylanicum TaxID=53326 RepID=A0A016WMW5_9BILA|nr:hypothetical protein Y032_0615g689 [Ancylostoma ceylanicum]
MNQSIMPMNEDDKVQEIFLLRDSPHIRLHLVVAETLNAFISRTLTYSVTPGQRFIPKYRADRTIDIFDFTNNE